MPVCLTIGSSDSSGGAGIQGDIKAYAAVGCYSATVVVGVTAQNMAGVRERWTLPIEAIDAQLDAVFDELPIAAVKVGTTWSAKVLSTIAVHLARCAERGVPIVVDPVITSTAGSTISRDVDLDAITRYLLPWATVVTPNRAESRLLASRRTASSRRAEAERIAQLGASTVVISPGPGETGDWFFDGAEHHLIEGDHHSGGAEHGAGCAHSATLAGLLAQRWSLTDAVIEAKRRSSLGVARGLAAVGEHVHPVDMLHLADLACARTESG
ncbi:bifunctional hydroxymethylpyrimidine kinase/phosphomethylpyrimidine kinase [Kribbella sp. CA-253562]|uniref:bifunctional hydroxymethylpyrimidine kinase/phosphomethylpyrimidine kinase n=1 Tax=Kribbella sp. CA-253562 TaxID=3239942 RepID=UPI003D8A6684